MNSEGHKFLYPAVLLIVLFLSAGCGEKAVQLGDSVEFEQDAGPESIEIYEIPDFHRYGIAERKEKFFDFLLPIIREENQRIREDKWKFRKLYAKLLNGYPLSEIETGFILDLADEYKVQGDISSTFTWKILLERIDVVPLPLASVQAAIESGWGTSRFARAGNNLFGQWCFRESCGIVPDRRAEGDIYEVATFRTVNESVRSYLRNLNTFSAYKEFRSLRLKQRLEEGALDSYRLAGRLEAYSTRRGEYVDELRLMLRVNNEFFDEYCCEPLFAENQESGELCQQDGRGISN